MRFLLHMTTVQPHSSSLLKTGFLHVSNTRPSSRKHIIQTFIVLTVTAVYKYTHPSLIAGLGSKTPREKRKSENLTPPPPENNALVFLVFSFSLQIHCSVSCFFFSFNSLNIMRCDSKTCGSCRTLLMLLSIEGPELSIFSPGETTRICETAK
jgi:hypothetical protein